MSIKVIIFRRVPAHKVNDLEPLLLEMRALALSQRGYISGESLMNEEDPEEHLVISSWTSKSRWEEWRANPRRVQIQLKIDALLDSGTVYKIYCNE